MDLDCVMLAAGISSRMEQWKMLLPCQGATVIECSVQRALEVCARVILVVGHRAPELKRLFQNRPRIAMVLNPRYREEMFASVKRGAAAVSSQRFFLALGDMPLVEPGVYRTLLEYPAQQAVIPKYRGKKGHPLLLSQAVGRRILEFPETGTLREVLAGFATLTVPVESKNILHDIDNPEDYRRLIRD